MALMRLSGALFLAVSLLLLASYPTTTDAQCIQSPGELGPLLDVLNADIKYWRDKLGGQKLTHENLTLLIGRNDYRWNDNPWNGEAAGMVNSAYTAVLIYNNKWYFPFREWGYDANCTRGDDWCSHRMTRTQEAFYRWTAAGARFPNSVFLLDLENGGSCRVEAECPAPVFSIFDVMKEPENFPNFEFRIQHGKGAIMVPDMTHSATTKLVTRPWNEKARKAIFRGSLHCPVIFVNRVCPCSRVHFVDMVKKPKPEHGDAPQFVDADGWDEHDAHADDIRIPDWPQEYSKYMFTLALDGQSGNMKMEGLLHINSVILKEHSPVVEFFERVIKPNEHYVPILLNNSYDALDLIKTMPESDMQRIANNAQQFAQRYLCDDAKRFYFQRAIEEYNSLFADMEGYITDVVLPLMSVKEHLGLGHHYQNLPKPDKFEP